MKPKSPWPLREIVEVEWADAVTRGGWKAPTDYQAEESMPCRTAGYLLKQTATEVVIIQSMSPSPSLSDSMTIPAGWVKKIRRLGKTR